MKKLRICRLINKAPSEITFVDSESQLTKKDLMETEIH